MYDPWVFANYKSPSQRVRLLTERWFGAHMYCPNCLNPHLAPAKTNTKVVDFSCENCIHDFQLKSKKGRIANKINDGAYRPMIERIQANTSPDFFFMQYAPEEWIVKNIFLVPRFFMNTTIIEKRTALSSHADRAGWIGCNILFSKLPDEARIAVVVDEKLADPGRVQKKYKALDFIDSKNYLERGWVSDVLYYVRRIGKTQFSLSEVYRFEEELKEIHPGNYHVRDKIRQQLQILRDRGILRFLDRGTYTLLD